MDDDRSTRQQRSPRPIPQDYDPDPERFRVARSVLRDHALADDVHEHVARRLLADGLTPVLDVGDGKGSWRDTARWRLGRSRQLADHAGRAPDPAMRAEATALPFSDASLGSVALLDVLYHLPEPARALGEDRRVLRPGGLVAVAAPSRHDSPELAQALPRGPLTLDAELAPRMLGELFGGVEVSAWDAPLLELPTRRPVCDYLIGKGSDPEQADAAAEIAEVPLAVTKRGALAFARKR